MKTIVYIVIAIVMVFTNSASAMTEHEVAQYVRDTVPGATNFDARMCADSWAHGGHFMSKSFDITLVCEKNHIVKDWDR